MKQKIPLACLSLMILIPLAVSSEWVPVDVSEFYITPNQTAELRWRATTPPTPEPLAFTLFDVNDKPTATGVAQYRDNQVTATVTLPQGYWEIAFDAEPSKRFGVVSQVAAAEPFEEFFAIDAALSWLVRGDDLREGIIKSAKRSGIGMMRERFRLAGIAPEEGKFDWQTRNRYDTLRQTYKKHGIDVLEMSHDAPDWMGKRKTYPKNLVQYADAWRAITNRWQASWGAVEVWNEPDIFFGGDLPADQYVALVKTLAYRFQRDGMKKPLVGGVVAHHNEEWINTAMANQLGELIDVFSFHTYDRAPSMEALLEKYQRLGIALWLTECGRPWKKGPDRPPVEQDLESVTDIVMKGIESKCCGVARYFPFVLPYYEENDNNFGMLDRQGTPLRSMAGYAQMIRVLAHTEYIGDLKPGAFSVTESMPPVLRARVFRKHDTKDDNAIIVLYTANMLPTECQTSFDVLRVESITGEILPSSPLVVTNGLVYLFVKVPESLVDADTSAKKMLDGAKKPRVTPKMAAPPFVTVFDSRQFEANSAGYRTKLDKGMDIRMPFTVFDLAGHLDMDSIVLVRKLPDAAKTGELHQASGTKPRQFEDSITFHQSGASLDELFIDYAIACHDRFASRVFHEKVALRFLTEPTWEGLLAKHKTNVPLDISPEKWRPSSSGRLSIDAAKERGVMLKCTFGDVDKWCYPRVAVPEGIDLTKFSGVMLRGRATGETTPRFFLHERDSGAGYMTETALFPADGEWHAVRIPFDRLVYCGATPIDPNGRLDLDNVITLSIGFNTKSAEATLEISDCMLILP